MNSLKYNFNNEEDLGFYILNSVCHDWIHDFNNYERMGKILNYIMDLVPSKELVEASTLLSDAVTKDADASDSKVAAPSVVSPNEYTVMSEDRNITDEIPSRPPKRKRVEVDAELEAEDKQEALAIQEEAKPEAASAPSVEELYASQVDQYLENISLTTEGTPIIATGLTVHQSIVNKSVEAFNYIKTNTQTYFMTRGNIRKINILQKLGDFIGEVKLLVISKITSITQRASGGSKKIVGGASAIDIIKTDDIILSINNIIREIDETANISEDIKKNLTNIFELIKEIFINFNIQGISPIEKFNNSIITEISSMFIVNKCENIDIKKEAVLYLKIILEPLSYEKIQQQVETIQSPVETIQSPLAKGINPTKTITLNRPEFLIPEISSNYLPSVAAGGGFSGKVYTDNATLWSQLDEKIVAIKSSELGLIYIGEAKISSNITGLYDAYTTFIGGMEDTLKLIIGPQMYNVKTKQISNFYTDTTRGGRNYIKNTQQMVDTMNDFIFDKVINTYEDTKNKLRASLEVLGESSRISGEARGAVQQISKLVAKKTLELTGYLTATGLDESKFKLNGDLKRQAEIIMQIVNSGKGYTTVDNQLIEYFNKTYGSNPLFKSGSVANNFIISKLRMCKRANCRVINNAIPNGDVKNEIKGAVVCPTSSVCDGMGAFGSCINPTSTQKEYFNMDFNISYLNGENFYQGSTRIKPNKEAVNINYGFKFNDLELYNFLDININTQPIVLQANYTFKGVINRIIEIWKSASTISDIDKLWELLEYNDYFLSILKLGSQKAIGDIFQEINSTIVNGGYSVPTLVNKQQTFGLMGDRPSGVRVLKLLKDSASGVNPNACGGYIGNETSLVYFPNSFKGGSKNTKKNTKKILKQHIKKTYKGKKYVNKSIKKRKQKNRKTKKFYKY